MGVRFDDFRRMPLAVWRAYVDSQLEAQGEVVRRLAWQVSWALRIGGGKEASPEVMLADFANTECRRGKSPRRELSPREKAEKMWERFEKRKAAGKVKE